MWLLQNIVTCCIWPKHIRDSCTLFTGIHNESWRSSPSPVMTFDPPRSPTLSCLHQNTEFPTQICVFDFFLFLFITHILPFSLGRTFSSPIMNRFKNYPRGKKKKKNYPRRKYLVYCLKYSITWKRSISIDIFITYTFIRFMNQLGGKDFILILFKFKILVKH